MFSSFLIGVPLALGVAAAPAPSARETLPFIHDDYPKAIAEARARKLPLFVETWAPWCHSCRSMKAFVFSDASLAREAGRFVWLDLNVDDERNAKVQDKLQIDGVPTLFVVDPSDEHVALRFLGGTTLDGLERLLDDGASAVSRSATGLGERLALADALYGSGRHAEAAQAYAELLASAPADWPRRSRASLARLDSLNLGKQFAACVAFAQELLPAFRHSPSAASVAGSGLDCASSLPNEDATRKPLLAQFEAAGREIVADTSVPAPADDRSSLYGSLVDVRKDAGDTAGAKALGAEWSRFLEAEATAARTPEERAVFDAHRVYAFIEAGHPESALPFLEQAERDRPKDPDPPSRLARVYRELKRWDDATAASDRALGKAQGVTRISTLRSRADLENDRGDKAAARRFLDEALRSAQALPSGKKADGLVAAIRKKIETLEPKAQG
jgi:tetratricopeptide (TPR) repeat protein